MSEQSISVSDAAFEIERLFRTYAEADKVFQPDELGAFAAFLHLLGEVAKSMEENLQAYRSGSLTARAVLTMAVAEASGVPGSNVIVFPVVRRENYGGAA